MSKTKQVCALFFCETEVSKFKCNKCGCVRTQAGGSGYSNLLSHLNSKYPTFMDEFDDCTRQSIAPLSSFGFVDDRTSEVFRWMQRIVERNHPLSELGNSLTRSIFKPSRSPRR